MATYIMVRATPQIPNEPSNPLFPALLDAPLNCGCPEKPIPIIKKDVNNTTAMKYSAKIRAAFDHRSKGLTSKKIISQNVDAFGSASSVPGGSAAPPRNF